MENFVNFVKANDSLKILNLDENLISDDGFKILAEGLMENQTLESLSISSNVNITNDSAIIIKELLKTTKIANVTCFKTDISAYHQKKFNKN